MKKIHPTQPARIKNADTTPLRTVLYVEDESENWEVTELRLRERFKLLWARNDREACEIVRHQSNDLYAILMDIQLKGATLDGIQLTRLFRGTLPSHQRPAYAAGIAAVDTPILFVTAYGNRYSEQELLEVGGSHFLTKPVDFVKLMLALAKFNLRKALQAGA